MRDVYTRLEIKSSPLVALIKDSEWLKSEAENIEETTRLLSSPVGVRCKIVVTINGEDASALSEIPFDVASALPLFEAELTRVKALLATAQSRLGAAEVAAQCEVAP